MAIVGISLVEYRKHEKNPNREKATVLLCLNLLCGFLATSSLFCIESSTYINDQPYLVEVFSRYGLVRKSPNNKET